MASRSTPSPDFWTWAKTFLNPRELKNARDQTRYWANHEREIQRKRSYYQRCKHALCLKARARRQEFGDEIRARDRERYAARTYAAPKAPKEQANG